MGVGNYMVVVRSYGARYCMVVVGSYGGEVLYGGSRELWG